MEISDHPPRVGFPRRRRPKSATAGPRNADMTGAHLISAKRPCHACSKLRQVRSLWIRSRIREKNCRMSGSRPGRATTCRRERCSPRPAQGDLPTLRLGPVGTSGVPAGLQRCNAGELTARVDRPNSPPLSSLTTTDREPQQTGCIWGVLCAPGGKRLTLRALQGVPGGQTLQLVAPSSLNLPEGQTPHSPAPAALHVPFSQGVHAEALSPL